MVKIFCCCSHLKAEIEAIKTGNDQILSTLRQFIVSEIAPSLRLLLAQGKTNMLNVTALTSSVAQNTSVIGSALTLIQGFKASQEALSKQLADAIASADPAALAAAQQAVDYSVAALSQSDTDLAAAVAANTPAAPPA